MIDCGNDFGYKLIARGELESFLQGRLRKITVRSIEAYIERRIAASKGKVGRCPQPLRKPDGPRTFVSRYKAARRQHRKAQPEITPTP